jgi:hypothetical protein
MKRWDGLIIAAALMVALACTALAVLLFRSLSCNRSRPSGQK